MKIFAVLAVMVAVAAADFSSWTLPQLWEAIQNPNTDQALLPALVQALNDLISVSQVPADLNAPVDLTGWTLHDLSVALQDPTTDPALIPYLEDALDAMMELIQSGIPVEAVGVPAKPFEVSYWSLIELAEAIENPATDPALIPYLEPALHRMMEALFFGNPLKVIAVVAPAGLAPATEAPTTAAPVFPSPTIVPEPELPDVGIPVFPRPPNYVVPAPLLPGSNPSSVNNPVTPSSLLK